MTNSGEKTMEETTQETTDDRKLRKVRVGTVVSDKMQKTIVVQIEHLVKHPTYRRYVRRRKRYKVHDEENKCHIGDVVSFMDTRPLSKDKRWRVLEILERAK
jgi:small subunit ribosomal protein S17